ncbi:zinc knuckle CX2CX4HX4C containing protein [Tanacetum coccineum]
MLERNSAYIEDYETLSQAQCVLNRGGQSSFARALIEIRVEDELKDSLIVVIPLLNGSGFCKEVVCMEYEWKPSRCHSCKKFCPTIDQCPRNIVPLASSVEKSDDGFQHVLNKRLRNSKNDNAKAGLKNGRTMCSNFKYVPKVTGNSSKYGSATAKVEHDSLFDANYSVVNKCDRLDGSSIKDAVGSFKS